MATASGELCSLPLRRSKENERDLHAGTISARENSTGALGRNAARDCKWRDHRQWFFFLHWRMTLSSGSNQSTFPRSFFCASRATHLRDLAVHAAAAITEGSVEITREGRAMIFRRSPTTTEERERERETSERERFFLFSPFFLLSPPPLLLSVSAAKKANRTFFANQASVFGS